MAAANILAGKLAAGNMSDHDLQAVQRRREFPTRATQRLQRLALLRRIPAQVVGMGFLPEHGKTAEKSLLRL